MEYDYNLRRSRSVTGWDRINSGELLRSSLTPEYSSPWTRRIQRSSTLPDLASIVQPRQTSARCSAISTIHEPERYRPEWYRNSYRSPWYDRFQYRPRFTSSVDFWPAVGTRHSYATGSLGPSWYVTRRSFEPVSKVTSFDYINPINYRGYVGRPGHVPYKSSETRSSVRGTNLYERGVIDFATFDRYFLRSAFVSPTRTAYDFGYHPYLESSYYRYW